MPFPCHAALIHTCHSAPLPFFDSAVSFVKVRVMDGNNRTASEIGMLLVTTSAKLRVVAGRSRRRTCRLWTADVNSHIPCRSHAALSLSERHDRGMAWERYGRGMACINQTRPHCVNQMGKTQYKPLTELHGRGTAWYV
jgi:hypothetical protein